MKRINRVGIIGAGTMGSALAQKFSQEGMTVVMVDQEDRFLERGLENIKETLNEGISRKLFSEEEANEILARVVPTTNIQDIAKCQLIIEAVFEDRVVKEEVFKQISRIVSPDAIVATNTSSFSVSDLSQFVSHPERFLGLHFFYHAAKNRLVEVVRGVATDDNTFRQALTFMQRCGKDPIVCKDSHGFVVNRFFVPWLNEAVRIYEEKLAKTGVIDTIACQLFGCGMGPFALMNATGVPIAYHAQKTLEAAFGPFYHPAEALRRQAENNQPWVIDEGGEIDPSLAEQIRDRFLGIIFLICGQLLDEKVCTAGEINRGARIGLRWKRGPMELFHRMGEEQVHNFVQAIGKQWKLSLPHSLTQEHWKPEFILTECRGKTGILTLTRPEDLNALNPTVARQFADAFNALDNDPNIETIIIMGQGKAFMAGADIKFFIDHIENQTISEIVAFTKFCHDLLRRIDDSRKTIVAVLNGLTLGGGLELALATDIIVALDRARLAFPETGIGIYPGLGGTQRTVQRIGKGLTKYLIYTGSVLSAQDALEIGLVDKIVDWEGFSEILEGKVPSVRPSKTVPPKWLLIEELFDKYTVDHFLHKSELIKSKMDTDQLHRLMKRIKFKASLALYEAERLIDQQKGTAAELERLEFIFSSQDALVGLKSVGGPPPTFRGV